MATLLMKLRDVPEDELQGLQALLDEHAIDYFETPPGRWGISMPALWIRDDEQAESARRLLQGFQAERQWLARQDLEVQRHHGTHETLLRRIWRHPLRSLFYLLAAAGVIYLSTKPFLDLAG